jgi:hypothetical protein
MVTDIESASSSDGSPASSSTIYQIITFPPSSKLIFFGLRPVIICLTITSLIASTLIAIMRVDIPRDKSLVIATPLSPVSYRIARRSGLEQSPDGCIAISKLMSPALNEDIEYNTLCLIDDNRLQRLRIQSSELLEGDAAIHVGTNCFVTLLASSRPISSHFSSSIIDLSEYTFDELEITRVKDCIYSDSQLLMVEVEGGFDLPPPSPCLAFADKDPHPSSSSPIHDEESSFFLVCGTAGKDSVLMNRERFSEVGVDLTKLVNHFQYLVMGNLASGVFVATIPTYEVRLQLFGGEIVDMEKKTYEDTISGELFTFSETLSSFSLSFS